MKAWNTQSYAAMPDGWRWLTGDADWQDHGGTWYKPLGGSRYMAIRHMAADCNDLPRYMVDLYMVDLADIDTADVLRSCGFALTDTGAIETEQGEAVADAEHSPIVILDAAIGYGAACPLWDDSADHYPLRLLAAARRFAASMVDDDDALESRLDRPVNRIGTSARDYGAGRLMAR